MPVCIYSNTTRVLAIDDVRLNKYVMQFDRYVTEVFITRTRVVNLPTCRKDLLFNASSNVTVALVRLFEQ